MYNAMNPTVYNNILAKFGIHPQKMAHAVGANGMGTGTGAAFGGQPPADPHGGGGAGIPADTHGGVPPTATPPPNTSLPHITPPSMGQLMGGQTGGGPAYAPMPNPAMTAGQPPADPRNGTMPANGQYNTYGQPQGNYQQLLTAGQPPAAATGQIPPWLQSLIAAMR